MLNSINPNVILLIIDSFRSDKFSDIDTSKKPNIDNLIKNGIFFSPGVSFISYSHTSEDIELTLKALEEICNEIKTKAPDEKYKKLLKGHAPKTIWTMKIQPTKKIVY